MLKYFINASFILENVLVQGDRVGICFDNLFCSKGFVYGFVCLFAFKYEHNEFLLPLQAITSLDLDGIKQRDGFHPQHSISQVCWTSLESQHLGGRDQRSELKVTREYIVSLRPAPAT